MTGTSEAEELGGRERILAAALEIMESQSEAAIRFSDVAARAGVTPGVITYHFGTREQLVAEVHAHRFSGAVLADLFTMRALLDTTEDLEGFFVGVAQLTGAVVDATRAEQRMLRIVSIAATHGREDLTERIRARATELLDGFAELIADAQARGFLDPTLDPRAIATFVQAYALGITVLDLDQTPVSRGELADLVHRLLWKLRGTGDSDAAAL